MHHDARKEACGVSLLLLVRFLADRGLQLTANLTVTSMFQWSTDIFQLCFNNV